MIKPINPFINNEIKPSYVSFNTAKRLKEKGFNVPTKYRFNPDKLFENESLDVIDWNRLGFTSRPEQWQVVEWLRVKYDIWIEVYYDNNKKEYYTVLNGEEYIFQSPQEAYSTAFDYILNNCEEQVNLLVKQVYKGKESNPRDTLTKLNVEKRFKEACNKGVLIGYKSNPNQYTQKDIEKAIELIKNSAFVDAIDWDKHVVSFEESNEKIFEQINSISVIEVDEQFNIISYE